MVGTKMDLGGGRFFSRSFRVFSSQKWSARELHESTGGGYKKGIKGEEDFFHVHFACLAVEKWGARELP